MLGDANRKVVLYPQVDKSVLMQKKANNALPCAQ